MLPWPHDKSGEPAGSDDYSGSLFDSHRRKAFLLPHSLQHGQVSDMVAPGETWLGVVYAPDSSRLPPRRYRLSQGTECQSGWPDGRSRLHLFGDQAVRPRVLRQKWHLRHGPRLLQRSELYQLLQRQVGV